VQLPNKNTEALESQIRVHKWWNEGVYPEKSAMANHCVSRRHKIGEMKLLKGVTNLRDLNA
jgi:hypothetical protein